MLSASLLRAISISQKGCTQETKTRTLKACMLDTIYELKTAWCNEWIYSKVPKNPRWPHAIWRVQEHTIHILRSFKPSVWLGSRLGHHNPNCSETQIDGPALWNLLWLTQQQQPETFWHNDAETLEFNQRFPWTPDDLMICVVQQRTINIIFRLFKPSVWLGSISRLSFPRLQWTQIRRDHHFIHIT